LSVTALASIAKRRRAVAEEVAHRAHHLRLAAQRIGVLHLRIAEAVAVADLAAGDQRQQGGGDLDLAGLAAQRLDARVERRVRALQRVDRERARNQRGIEHARDVGECRQRDRGRDLRAVDQREPFLGAERERRLSNPREGFGSRQGHAIEPDLADAHQRGREMRERRKIAGSADRALGGNDGQCIMTERAEQRLDYDRTHARSAARQARRLHRQDQPDHVIGQGRAGSDGMREDEIALQRREIAIGDAHAGELAEAGIDAIGHGPGRNDVIDDGLRCSDSCAALGRQRDGGTAEHVAPMGQGGLARCQGECRHRPFQMRA
jgi:hypothetical protein